jgi:hypothetical protein
MVADVRRGLAYVLEIVEIQYRARARGDQPAPGVAQRLLQLGVGKLVAM